MLICSTPTVDIHRADPEFGYRFIADELAGARHRRRGESGARLCSASNNVVGARQEAGFEP